MYIYILYYQTFCYHNINFDIILITLDSACLCFDRSFNWIESCGRITAILCIEQTVVELLVNDLGWNVLLSGSFIG